MLAAHGADKLTMDGLAERSELGKGTVLRRFTQHRQPDTSRRTGNLSR
jgi:hypothetical protein